MGQVIVDVIFKILNTLAGVFLNPIFSLISVIVPSLAQFFTSILTFVNYGLEYISFFIKLLMIPTAPLITFVSLFIGVFVFNMTIRTVGLGMAIYKYFKP